MSNKKEFVSNITDMEKDFPQWYTDVVLKTELVDYGPVKGTMVIRPYGYAIWEKIQDYLNAEFKKVGIKNAYFPMFIPESFLKKEAKHVEGFAPEVAVVTYAGGQELSEKLIIRPTSETIIGEMYSKWIKSYRDLPLKLNQWCNVVRWEKTTRPFLRTSEFLWQEGHTVFDSMESAKQNTIEHLEIYKKMGEELLAIPFLTGRKTESEKFAGAEDTYTIEAIMHDGKSLQSGTSHNLGQNFAKAFDIKFLNKNGELEYGYTTSFGVSTRLIGAIVMVHGDNRGLVLPPKIAPIQAVIVPIGKDNEIVNNKASELENLLKNKGIRVFVDNSQNSPGWKFNEWEMKGVPIRIEIGPRDLENNNAVVFRRDNLQKQVVGLNNLDEYIENELENIQKDLFKKAKENLDNKMADHKVQSVEDLKEVLDDKKFALAYYCGEEDCADNIKAQTGATARCIEKENLEGEHTCFACGKKAKMRTYFARSY